MAVNVHRSLICVWLLAMASWHVAWPAPAAHNEPPEWRAALYDLFQNRPLKALTRILARDAQGLWPSSLMDEVIAAEAALYAELGLPEASARALAKLKTNQYNTEGYRRLQLLMVKQYFSQGQLNEARQLLAQIDVSRLTPSLATEWHELKGQIDFSQGRYQEAAEAFAQISVNPTWLALGQYNQAVSLLRQNKLTEAMTVLQPLLSSESPDEQIMAVRDKAWTALGWYALKNDKPKVAQQYLTHVRQNSPTTWEAALLLGWAYAKQSDYQSAARFWSYLVEQNDPLHPAIQEAWLALPYAQQQLGDLAGALAGYQKAQERAQYAQHILKSALQSRQWLAAWNAPTTKIKGPTASLLQYLATDPELAQLLKQWEQLAMWRHALHHAKQKIPVLQWAVSANETRFQTHKTKVTHRLAEIPLETITRSVTKLVEENQRPYQVWCDLRRIDTPWQTACLRLKRAETLLASLPNGDTEKYRRRLNHIRGVLYWHIARTRPIDQWTNQKAIIQLVRAHDELKARYRRLQEIATKNRPPIEPVLARLEELMQRTQHLEKHYQTLEAMLSHKIYARADQLTETMRMALADIERQAQLAIARLQYASTPDMDNPEGVRQ